MTKPEFSLYPVEQHWWSFNDYRAVRDVVKARGAKTVLEFGPGSSTLALIEGGATTIDACEDDPVYFTRHRERLWSEYPTIVTLHAYTWTDPVYIPQLRGRWYDLALIDGPHDTDKRIPVIDYCLQRCEAVLVPTEEDRGDDPPDRWLRAHIERLAKRHAVSVEYFDTGPLAGAFAFLK